MCVRACVRVCVRACAHVCVCVCVCVLGRVLRGSTLYHAYVCRSLANPVERGVQKEAGEAMAHVMQAILSYGHGLWLGPDTDGEWMWDSRISVCVHALKCLHETVPASSSCMST